LPFPEKLSPSDPVPAEHLTPEPESQLPDTRTWFKHGALLVLTFITVTFSGILWVGQTAHAEGFMDMVPEGALFSFIFLLFLASHEFGHYFAAIHHGVRVTLPYFIPVPFGIGTLGAVIRIKEKIEDSRKLFDIGIAGPIAGFVISLATLLYGFMTLPGPEYIYNFEHHEELVAYVEAHGAWPDSPPAVSEESEGTLLFLGDTLLFSFMASFFDNAPPMWEMYHYPFLFAGWLGLFFTALNLMPIGQLDGGHILYSLIGFRRHRTVARLSFGLITLLAGVEVIPFIHELVMEWSGATVVLAVMIWAIILYFLMNRACDGDQRWAAPLWAGSLVLSAGYLFISGDMHQTGSMIWVFWSFFLTFFVGLEHPPARYEQNLTTAQRVLGWSSMVIFVLCISPRPIYITF